MLILNSITSLIYSSRVLFVSERANEVAKKKRKKRMCSCPKLLGLHVLELGFSTSGHVVSLSVITIYYTPLNDRLSAVGNK